MSSVVDIQVISNPPMRRVRDPVVEFTVMSTIRFSVFYIRAEVIDVAEELRYLSPDDDIGFEMAEVSF
jgi:hypothetical protein